MNLEMMRKPLQDYKKRSPPKKISGLQRDLNLWPLRLRFSALPTKYMRTSPNLRNPFVLDLQSCVFRIN